MKAPPQTCTKARLRQSLRDKRNKLDCDVRLRWDKSIRRHLASLVQSLGARRMAGFFPFNGEPDIAPLCRRLMLEGYEIALPVISASDDHGMEFHAWRDDTRLIPNRFGIPEPAESELVQLSTFDILMMPLVGYDRLGNRLGMGGGYYDRHLESLRDAARPLRVGVAYDVQEIDPIDNNIWDIPLHGVVNERGWFTFVD